jgi:dienelactone hydrolase
MHRLVFGLVALGVFLLGACVLTRGTRAAETVAPGAKAYTADPGPYAVATVEYTWTDPARNRQVPVKIYYPQTGAGPFPVIIFSHGLGGTREGYEYLGRHWASYGYVSVHPQHLGSDDSVWQGQADPMEAMREAIRDINNALDRLRDIPFVLDQVTALNAHDPVLAGRLDLTRLGMAGHSFGAWTTMAEAGEIFTLPSGQELSFAEPRFKAAISMSASGPSNKADLDHAYSAITIPILHMTGTQDYSIVTDSTPADKRVGFDHTHGADAFLVTFNGGDHMVFSGRGVNIPGRTLDAEFQPYILMCTTAFWDAYLKDDAAARAWLTQGGWAGVLDGEGIWEQKLKG